MGIHGLKFPQPESGLERPLHFFYTAQGIQLVILGQVEGYSAVYCFNLFTTGLHLERRPATFALDDTTTFFLLGGV